MSHNSYLLVDEKALRLDLLLPEATLRFRVELLLRIPKRVGPPLGGELLLGGKSFLTLLEESFGTPPNALIVLGLVEPKPPPNKPPLECFEPVPHID
jgi:hypothetical protein